MSGLVATWSSRFYAVLLLLLATAPFILQIGSISRFTSTC
jgi:hypothetical protein